jgi:hypothetical protein
MAEAGDATFSHNIAGAKVREDQRVTDSEQDEGGIGVMTINLPKSMVYYSESRNQPEYLLCWIPSRSFPDVARDDKTLDDLRKYYPNGIEIEVSEDALEAGGIKLALHSDDLRKAYVQLHEANMLCESGMIAAKTLEPIAEALQPGTSIEELRRSPPSPFYSVRGSMTDAISRLFEGTDEPPEMTGDEDAEVAFRRLSGR